MQTHLPADRQWCELTDDVLLQQSQAGEQRAFECLVNRYSPLLSRIIFRMLHDEYLTSDVLQHVFLQMYRMLPAFHSGKTLKAWLLQVAQHRCIDELRHKRLLFFSELTVEKDENENETPAYLSLPDLEPLPEEVVIQRELEQILHEAIESLPVNYRLIVRLHSIGQLSFREIGQVLGIPVTTAKTNFYRARRLLRVWYNAEYTQVATENKEREEQVYADDLSGRPENVAGSIYRP
jgi:RNA polymerase sigma-70 factor, ECF subfamily